eukprot:9882157-Lingulodinium_polyedra.AAC.1
MGAGRAGRRGWPPLQVDSGRRRARPWAGARPAERTWSPGTRWGRGGHTQVDYRLAGRPSGAAAVPAGAVARLVAEGRRAAPARRLA